MEADSSRTLVFTNSNTRSEDDNPHFHRRQNFKHDEGYKAVNVILL